MPYTISAVDRALSLLEALAEHPGLSVTELARVSGNTKSLVFRLIYTLERRGYVIREQSSRTYTLGYRPLYLAASAQDNLLLVARTAPFLDDLARSTGEQVNLVVRDGAHCLCVATRAAPGSMQLYAQVGRRIPMHAGGGPKILLAFAPDDVQAEVIGRALDGRAEPALADRAALDERLDAIRRTGTNESRGDLDRNAFSIAAAIRGRDGEVIAAVSVAGTIEHLGEGVADAYRAAVDEASRRCSEAMGWRPRPAGAI